MSIDSWSLDASLAHSGRRAALRRMFAGTLAVLAEAAASESSKSDSGTSRIGQMITDMSLPHEFPLHGIVARSGWHFGPFITMGAVPYGRAVPSWWKPGIRHDEWHSLAAWFTVYLDARGSFSSNTGVEINGLESWVFRRTTRHWDLLRAQIKPKWQGAFHPNATDNLNRSGGRMGPSADEGFVATPDLQSMVHGGMQQTAVPWDAEADMLALLVSVRHRLALVDPSGVDDRLQARMGVIAGADYYPWVGASLADLGARYNPGAGSGRLIRSEIGWRYSSVLLMAPAITAKELREAPHPEFVY